MNDQNGREAVATAGERQLPEQGATLSELLGICARSVARFNLCTQPLNATAIEVLSREGGKVMAPQWLIATSPNWRSHEVRRMLRSLLVPRPVLSLSTVTLENNEKIRPQPERENAFSRASGGEEGIRTLDTVSRILP